jgi:transcriptional regulator with XRE-family HTH domain
MSKKTSIILPSLQRKLSTLGENIRLARLRRKYSASIVSQRAGISRNTLRAIENGEPSVSFGAYANVLMSLGLEQDICLLANDDELGRKLQDANLPLRARAPRVALNTNHTTNKPTTNTVAEKHQSKAGHDNPVKPTPQSQKSKP